MFSLRRRAKILLFSLNRRALAPLAWLRALRRAGAVAPAGPLRGPVPLTSHTPSGAGRSLRSLGLRALRRAGAVAPAGPLRGPVPLTSHTPSGAGRSLRSLGSAPCGAPARSRRPGRCAARSRSLLTPPQAPGALCSYPLSDGRSACAMRYDAWRSDSSHVSFHPRGLIEHGSELIVGAASAESFQLRRIPGTRVGQFLRPGRRCVGNRRGTGGAAASRGDGAQVQVRRHRERLIVRLWAVTSISKMVETREPFPTQGSWNRMIHCDGLLKRGRAPPPIAANA